MVNPNRPVAFVADEVLLDDLLKLAAAAGCDLERVPDTAAVRQCWHNAPLVLLDHATVQECVAHALPPRNAIVVVATEPEPPELWKRAMELGAERVISLPGAEPWLVNALADAAEGPSSNAGKVLAVLGARGGAGASIFSVAVSLTALEAGENRERNRPPLAGPGTERGPGSGVVPPCVPAGEKARRRATDPAVRSEKG